MHDDLDAVFGSAGGSFSQQASTRGNAEDPFELFGGLGTSQKAAANVKTARGDNFFPGMSGTLILHIVGSPVKSLCCGMSIGRFTIGSV